MSRFHFIVLLEGFYLSSDYMSEVFAVQLCSCQKIHNNEEGETESEWSNKIKKKQEVVSVSLKIHHISEADKAHT